MTFLSFAAGITKLNSLSQNHLLRGWIQPAEVWSNLGEHRGLVGAQWLVTSTESSFTVLPAALCICTNPLCRGPGIYSGVSAGSLNSGREGEICSLQQRAGSWASGQGYKMSPAPIWKNAHWQFFRTKSKTHWSGIVEYCFFFPPLCFLLSWLKAQFSHGTINLEKGPAFQSLILDWCKTFIQIFDI